jgi:NADPH:quinone reductase-like Zn-dependent oxidoreductase
MGGGHEVVNAMRAAVYREYGGAEVVLIEEVETPRPAADEILIRVRATTVTSGDWRARSLETPRGFGPIARLLFGLRRPRNPILGTELAGDVAAVGTKVKRFKVGDAVFAYPGAKMGGHAEYRTMREDGAVAHKPDALGYGEAAALSFGGTTALHFLQKANIKAGERILVNGASGCVGSAAIQLAKHEGAHVTAVTSTKNTRLVRDLGADAVIDYTREDFTGNGETYDIIMDTVGNIPYARARASLADGGRLLLVATDLAGLLGAPWVRKHKVIADPAPERADYLRTMAELVAEGAYRPLIDRVYPFEEIVEAHRHVDTGRKRGSVVVEVEP